MAPAKTPPQVVEKLQREVAKALAAPDVREKLVAQGAVVVGGTGTKIKVDKVNAKNGVMTVDVTTPRKQG